MKVDLFSLPPTDPLSGLVIEIFRLRATGAFKVETILPKGQIDILFNFGSVIATQPQSTASIAWTSTLVSGLHTAPIVARPDRSIHTLGASIRPEAAFPLLGLSLDELTNRCVDGMLVFPEADSMLNRLGETDSFESQCRILLAWFEQRAVVDRGAALVARAARLLSHATGGGEVGRASAALGLTPRHLHRLFKQRIGLSPAGYVKLRRFASALPLIAPRRTLTDVAVRAGYFDHAHFCRDFRAFAGMTPDDYRQVGSFVPGHIFSS